MNNIINCVFLNTSIDYKNSIKEQVSNIGDFEFLDCTSLDELNEKEGQFIIFDGTPLGFIDLEYFLSHANIWKKCAAVCRVRNIGQSLLLLNEDYTLKEKAVFKEVQYDGYVRVGIYFYEGAFTKSRFEVDSDSTYFLPTVKKDNYKFFEDKRPALFLDRDGILNIDTIYAYKFEEMTFHDEMITVIKKANDLGFRVVVLTNQSGIAREKFTKEEVVKVHNEMGAYFLSKGAKIDDWYYCPFHLKGIAKYRFTSLIRKPDPGMILMASDDYSIDINKSVMIGDKPSDGLYAPGLNCFYLQGQYDLSTAKGRIFSSHSDLLENLNDFLSTN